MYHNLLSTLNYPANIFCPENVVQLICLMHHFQCLFVQVDALWPSQEFFSHVGTFRHFLGWTSTKLRMKHLTQGLVQQCLYWGSNQRLLNLKSRATALPIFKCTPHPFYYGSKLWMLIRLLLRKQSDLGPYYLQYRLPTVGTVYERADYNWCEKQKIVQVHTVYGKCVKISNTSCLLKQPKQTGQPQIRLLLKKHTDQGLPCLLFWHSFVNSSPKNQHFIWEQKELSVQNFKTFSIPNKFTHDINSYQSWANHLLVMYR